MSTTKEEIQKVSISKEALTILDEAHKKWVRKKRKN